MSLWAAENLALVQAQETIQTFLSRLRPSIAVLGNLAHPTGAAAMIDAKQGLFLAHSDAVQGNTVQARLGDGALVLAVLARDTRTSLVLLGIKAGYGPLTGPTITLVNANPAEGTKVMVLLANDAVVGSFVGGDRFSIRDDRKQVVPVSELRFETPPQLVSGALVLTLDGKLVGAMGATVSRQVQTANRLQKSIPVLGGSAAPGRSLVPKIDAPMGPGDLTVAYSPSLGLMRRVVEGFLSEDHRPEYAVLGIQVDNNPDGGVRVKTVTPDYPAGKAGVKVGDVLLQMNDFSIVRRGDFIRAMLELEPGAKTKLRLRRGATDVQLEVVLARSKG